MASNPFLVVADPCYEAKWGLPDRASTQLDEELCVVDHGRVVCCVGLSASFYVADGHTMAVRERIVQLLDLYRAAVGDALRCGGDPRNNKLKQLAGTSLLDVRGWLPRLSPNDGFEPDFYGGATPRDASPYHFSVLAETGFVGELSSISFSVPLSWASGRPQGAYLELVLSAAKLLRPEHGYGGLSVILPPREPGQGSDMACAVPIALRFRGVDLDIAFMQTRFMHKGIKGVNWLTILGDAWIEKLGGVAPVNAALGADIPVHMYEGGIIIQAGPHPVFGDVNRSEPMPYYERVAQVVKPIRLVDFRAVAPHHGMDRERTKEWLARFER